ncbi:MAG: hypothetical protein KBG20_08290 [Caldilineaceae bacterium]|nr:hypothetical protein [Caldilineaceae bacterium]MBP8107683.1 hypothetical protein [Caldilineaceae bacterium]MBP8122895.1 hypothetical protein [Caldilineaceae bacterium]MBP9072282.1 hypothetical protein [Caldilineaceae bacterium]
MSIRIKWVMSIVAVVALSLVVFVGAAFAQTDTPADGTTNPLVQMQQWMEENHGEGAWAAMIQRMTETHGAEFTGEMLQKMATGESCHGDGEFTPGSMIGEGGTPGSMMGEGVSGHGMMGGGFRGMMGGAHR